MRSTTLVLTPYLVTQSDTRLRETRETVRIPLCDSNGLCESGEGPRCSRDLVCMCDSCVNIDAETVGAVRRGVSSVRMAPVSARLVASVRYTGRVTLAPAMVLATVLVTGLVVGTLVGSVLATVVR